jgi:hypothetical protein
VFRLELLDHLMQQYRASEKYAKFLHKLRKVPLVRSATGIKGRGGGGGETTGSINKGQNEIIECNNSLQLRFAMNRLLSNCLFSLRPFC